VSIAAAVPSPLAGIAGSDRFGVAVFGSALFHLLLLLGVGFVFPQMLSRPDLPTIEVTLVNSRSEQAPKDAEFLAQANQDGGGDTDRHERAKSPLPLRPVPDQTSGPPAYHIQLRRQSAPAVNEFLTSRAADAVLPVAAQAKPRPGASEEEVLRPGLVPGDEGMRERANLAAEISQFWQEYQKRPRRKFVSARTREHKYAAYMEAWRAKVERVGNLNYPDEARRRGLSGSLILDVALNADGTVNDIIIRRSSGERVLDDAAVRIVNLAAPFSPLPPHIREDTDILHITRTWQFINNQGFR
jgi:protein TonB